MSKILYSLFLLALLFSCSPKQDNTPTDASVLVDENVRTRIDSALKSLVDEGRIAGISALVFERDEEVYFNAYGFADREASTPMDRNTIVKIYSMTKPVTGVALMTLYEEGKFQLDDPLEKYAPEFANMKVITNVDASGNLILEPAKRPITIRDITRHTAGFPNSQDIPALAKLLTELKPMDPNHTLSEMAATLGKLPLIFHPGEQWSYGVSVDVQAFLVERLSGVPFDKYLRENILDPLGMKTTGYVVSENDLHKFSAAYRRGTDGQLTRIPDEEANGFNIKEWPMKPGGYGLTSTIDDYMRFARMLVNEGKLGDAEILKEETVRLMATNQLSDSVKERMWLPSKGQVGFGIDFAVRLRPQAHKDENNGVVGEFFWDGAASTLFWVDPVNELTAVLFVQVMPFDREVHRRFREAIYGVYKAE